MNNCTIFVLPHTFDSNPRQSQKEQSFRLLQYGAKQCCGREIQREDIVKTPGGKPYFAADIKGCFNLSHCRQAVAAAFCQCQVGIDIESPRKISKGLLNKCLSPSEREYVHSQTQSEEAFLKLWTLKESYVKMTGTGLTSEIASTEFVIHPSGLITSNLNAFFYQWTLPDNLIVSVCLEKECRCQLEVLTWS